MIAHMPASARLSWIERASLVILFAWLLWLPLPFGSNVPGARLPLIAVPLALCAVCTMLRTAVTSTRTSAPEVTRAWRIWSGGGALFVLACALALVPLPPSLLNVLSPESSTIWSAAARVATLSGLTMSPRQPISVDPAATALEVFRVVALLATFVVAALLVRTHTRRLALAIVLCAAALFEMIYGVREAALQRYSIWGWENRLIFNRVTGTFVNPNHFAHYLAIVLPMALFIAAFAWRSAAQPHATLARNLARLIESRLLLFAPAAIAAIGCVAAILLAQSRGGLLAAGAGLLVTGALLPGRRLWRIGSALAGGAIVIVALVVLLGRERTVERFTPTETEQENFVGRRIGISAALGVWNRFALFGSGAGTFERVVAMEQTEDLEKVYHHAHDDYVEIAATTGTVGFVIAMVTLLGGYVALARTTFGASSRELIWRRRAFQAAALASLTIAMIHALFDFNFFIPANPATLAAILGAAVAPVDHDKRTRR